MVKKVIRHQAFLFDEPNKNEAGDKPDDTGGISDLFVSTCIFGKSDVLGNLEIPVGNLAEEPLVEFGAIENLLPRSVQFHKIGEFVFAIEFVQR